MKVTVTSECVSCGLCAESCPDVFEMGDDAAEVKVDVVPGELEQGVRDAADECPVEAIEVAE